VASTCPSGPDDDAGSDVRLRLNRALELAPADEHRWRASASGLMAIAFWGSGDLQAAHSA
jgi:hypothetical protein